MHANRTRACHRSPQCPNLYRLIIHLCLGTFMQRASTQCPASQRHMRAAIALHHVFMYEPWCGEPWRQCESGWGASNEEPWLTRRSHAERGTTMSHYQQPINQLTQRNHNHCCFVLFICFEYGFHFAEIFDFSKKIPRWAGHREVIVLKLPTKLCSEPANAGFDSGCPANPKIQNCKICEDSIHFLRRNYR